MVNVSIVIPAYNCSPFLGETLVSAIRQDYESFEIIVIDDGSTDDTARIAREAGSRVRYVRQENSGVSKARNRGIALAKGKYIALLDGDDLMLPDQVRRLAEVLDHHPEVAFAFTDYQDFRGDDHLRPRSDQTAAFTSMPKQVAGEHARIIDGQAMHDMMFVEYPVLPSGVMFRKSLVDRIGGFREDLTHAEDMDFAFRAACQGAVGYIHKVCFLRRLHESNATNDIMRLHEGTLRVLRHHFPRIQDARIKHLTRRRLIRMHQWLGFGYREKGLTMAALSQFLRCIQLKPFPSRAYLNIVRTLVQALLPQARRPPPQTRR